MNEEDRHKPPDIRNAKLLPEYVLALQQEVLRYHIHLVTKYSLNNKDFGECLGSLAAEVSVVMDGMYDEAGLEAVSRIVVERLKNRRSILLTEPSILVPLREPLKPLGETEH